MTAGSGVPQTTPVTGDRWRWWRRVGHAAAVGVILVGLVATIARPAAPAIGEPLPALRWFDDSFRDLAWAYQRPRDVVAVIAVAVRVAVAIGLAASPPGRRVVGRIAGRLGHRPWMVAAVVAGATVVLVDLLLSPLAFWSGFVHDGVFGLRTQGLGGWLRDWVVFRVPGWAGAVALAAAGYAVARRCPCGWPPLVALGGAVVVAVMVMAGPVVLEPLRHDTTPLADGPARRAVEDVAEAADLGVDEVLVADASRRTARENAYVSGLGATRRMVLYDTLVEARQPDEIRAVVAHEVAHHQHRDLERGTLAAAGAVVAGVYALAWWLRHRTGRGRQREITDPRACGVVIAAVLIVSVLATPVEAAVSRRMEAAADWQALQLTGDPAAHEQLRVELARSNLSRPDPPGWRHVWWGTHPRPVERLTMVERARRTTPP